jgi:competence protein ComEA
VVQIDRRHLVTFAAAGLLLVALGLRLLGGRDAPAGERIEIGGAPAGPQSPASRSGRSALYVHVAGAVARPGLYRVAAGARVAAAIEMAGGTRRRADLTAVNLAARVEDGQQIVVPARASSRAPPAPARAPATGAAPGSRGATPSMPGAQISLSAATLEQLDALDGIGPTLAQRILDYRDAHGGFRSVDELEEVEGIGEKRMESLRRAVRP